MEVYGSVVYLYKSMERNAMHLKIDILATSTV